MELPPRIYPWDDQKMRMRKHAIIRRQINERLWRHRRRRLLEDIKTGLYGVGILAVVAVTVFQLWIAV